MVNPLILTSGYGDAFSPYIAEEETGLESLSLFPNIVKQKQI